MKSTLSPTKERIIATLGALALFLSILEHVIPKPIPFIRIGFANVPILISLVILSPKETVILILIKSLGSSLVTGTLFSWLSLYSLAGSLFSGTLMIIVKTALKDRVSMVGVSVMGALSSNITQITLAYLILGKGVIYLGLPILVAGLISGIVLGLFTNKFIKDSKWVKSLI